MISEVHTDVVHPLTLWQAAYLAKGDESGGQKIEKMLSLLNKLTMAMHADVIDYGKEDMIAKQWQQKYMDDMNKAAERIKELEDIIKQEKFFIAK